MTSICENEGFQVLRAPLLFRAARIRAGRINPCLRHGHSCGGGRGGCQPRMWAFTSAGAQAGGPASSFLRSAGRCEPLLPALIEA